MRERGKEARGGKWTRVGAGEESVGDEEAVKEKGICKAMGGGGRFKHFFLV